MCTVGRKSMSISSVKKHGCVPSNELWQFSMGTVCKAKVRSLGKEHKPITSHKWENWEKTLSSTDAPGSVMRQVFQIYLN